MEKKFGWGIIGTGYIANIFAADIRHLDDAFIETVYDKDHSRAMKFASANNIKGICTQLKDLIENPNVDIVYVATPHSFHREVAIQCLQAKKAVLCEKPMAINEKSVQEMIQCARDNNTFLMEGMLTHSLPVMEKVKNWVREKKIGDVKMLVADFGFLADFDPQNRLFNLNLGGGALLDVGIYPISFASMVFGRRPERIEALAKIGETGIDEQTSMIFRYDSGALALLYCSICANSNQEAKIYGTKGYIEIPEFWKAVSAYLIVKGEKPVKIEESNNKRYGINYEVIEIMECLRNNKKQGRHATLEETLDNIRILDRVRQLIGLHYPME
jgi:dihydrodiol dehydrogenase / D-xylose 1-dehydrogenase (NADP)